jgi:hypothetical protein
MNVVTEPAAKMMRVSGAEVSRLALHLTSLEIGQVAGASNAALAIAATGMGP